MDAELERRWQTGDPPFAAGTLTTEDYLPLGVLRRALRTVLVRLHRATPDEEVFTLADWHFHDPHLTEPSPISWPELMSFAASDDLLLAANPDDDLVFRGAFPASRAWYLRYTIPEVDTLPGNDLLSRHGRFDLSANDGLLQELRRDLRESGLIVKTLPAAVYFHRGY